MIKVKKAFAWLFGNFSSTLIFCWLPPLVVKDFLNTDDPDGWDNDIAKLMFVAFSPMLVTELITYRRKIGKKNL